MRAAPQKRKNGGKTALSLENGDRRHEGVRLFGVRAERVAPFGDAEKHG